MDEEFEGDYEVVGADEDALAEYFEGDYEVVGATGRRRRVGVKGQPRVRRSRVPRNEYHQILPCTALTFSIGETRTIKLTPQRTFRPEIFGVSSAHTGPFFTLSFYSIGQDNQFVGEGVVPCDLFTEVAVHTSRIVGYTANLGNTITLTVTNISGVAGKNFYGAFLGTSLGN